MPASGKNSRPQSGKLSGKPSSDKDRSPDAAGQSRGMIANPAPPEPQTEAQRREEAGSGSQAAAQGPSGSPTVGKKAQSSKGQDQPKAKAGDTFKRRGTGGGESSYGPKR